MEKKTKHVLGGALVGWLLAVILPPQKFVGKLRGQSQ